MAEEMVESISEDAAADTVAQSEESRPMGSSPRTYTEQEVDARIKARIDKQNARHAEEMEGIRAKLEELEKTSKAAIAERDELARQRQATEWANEAAAETGVPASVIRGATLEEMLEHAKAIKAEVRSYPNVEDHGGGTQHKLTKESIRAIKNSAERKAAIAANIDLF